MGTEIDRLDMKIEAEASDANKQLEETVSRLKEILAPLNDIMNHKAFVQLKQQSKEIDKSLTRISKETKAAMQGVSASMEKATKPMGKAVKDVSAMVAELNEKFKDFSPIIDFSQSEDALKKDLDKYKKQMIAAQNELNRILTSSSADRQVGGMERWIQRMNEAQNAIKEINDYLNQLPQIKDDVQINMRLMGEKTVEEHIESIKNDLEGIEFGKLTDIQIENLQQDLEYLKTNLPNEIDLINQISDALKNAGVSAESSYRKLSDLPVEKLINRANVIKEKIETIKTAFTSGTGNEFKLEENEEYKHSLLELNKIVDLINSKKIQDMIPEESVNRVKSLAEYLQIFKQKLESAFLKNGLKAYTSQYTELQNEITKTEKTLATLNAQLARSRETVKNFDNITAYRKMQYDIAGAKKELQRLREEQDKLKTSGGATQWNFKGLSEGLQNFKKALRPLGTALKNLDKRITAFVKKLRSIIFPARSAKKSVDGFHKSLSGGLGTILKYSFGIRSLFVLFNRMRSAATEGFQNLVLYSDKVNASISLLMNSANQLKNSFAAMVAPILNAVAPALNYLMQLCVKAANAVNQLISALLGNDTWIRAKKLTQDYRDTIQGVKDDVEEVTKTILGFDQLHVLNGKNEKTDSGTGNLLPEDMFETLPVESKFKDLADKIKGILSQFFAPLKEAWNREGKFVMDSWKYALDEIWALIKSIGSDFLEVWQQEKTIKIFEDILHIIGDIGLVVGNLAHNFREAWEENETGKKILEGIRDIIGVIVANIRHAADATVEWSANLDFSPLLTKIQAWVESLVPVFDNLSGIVTDFYEKVLLPLGKWTIEKGLPDLVQVFIDFNEKVDWEALRERLAQFWEHLEPFAETVGEGLILFIERISDALADFINSPQFDDFLTAIENWMDNVDAEDVANTLENIAKAIISLKVAVAGFSAVLKGISALSNLVNVLKFFGAGGGAKSAFSGLKSIGTAIAGWAPHIAVGVAIVNVMKRIKEAVSERINTSGFGITDWISETLKLSLEGWASEFENFKISLELWWQDTWMSDAIWKFGQWWDEKIAPWFTQEQWAELWESVKTAFSTKWEEIVGWWNESAIGKWWSENVTPWFEIDSWSELFSKIHKALSGVWNSLVKWWNESAIGKWWNDNVLPWFEESDWSDLYSVISDALEAVWNELVEWWESSALGKWWEENVAPWFEEGDWSALFKVIKTTLKSIWDETAGQWISDITNWWNNDVSPWFDLKTWIDLLSKIPTAFSDAFNAAKEKALGVVEELYNKIVGWVGKMVEKIEKVIEKAKEAIGLSSSSGSSSGSSSSSVGKRTASSSSKLSVNIPKITIPTIKVPTISVNIPKFATGGFPEDGFFFANHNELIGKFSNGQTAVANNEQIISGIKQGVYEAVMSAMQINTGHTGNERPIYITIKTENDEVLARAVTRGQEKIDRRYKPSMP